MLNDTIGPLLAVQSGGENAELPGQTAVGLVKTGGKEPQFPSGRATFGLLHLRA